MADKDLTKKTVYQGLTVGDVLLIVFIVLKLTNQIDWSWVWVLSPLWIMASLVVAIVLVGLIVWLIVVIVRAVWQRRRRRKTLTAADVAAGVAASFAKKGEDSERF